MTSPTALHVFSVDVEEYFQVLAFEQTVPRPSWGDMPSRVEASVDQLLELLARHSASATFFTVGWLAERKPDLIKRIAGLGHEIACRNTPPLRRGLGLGTCDHVAPCDHSTNAVAPPPTAVHPAAARHDTQFFGAL